ncbi:helix-turn-helix domain-containing protein [Inediibacterium massiliense]|uniref:helix-turn-helix domain-containing protein n=1 Tax=Inediibacterium massiliense TaxID=1658111 RepID=UPI0006B559CD|nr:helix-turn-helix transcriptional regulator [Inediibacterium massiliense]
MKGLEYICEVFDKKYSDIAKDLGISRQNVSIWIKGTRSIPKKHLKTLSEIFDIPPEYFDKKLSEKDKSYIDRKKLKIERKEIDELLQESYVEFEDTVIDPATGEEITINRPYLDEGLILHSQINQFDINKSEILEQIKGTLQPTENKEFGYLEFPDETLKVYGQLLKIINSDKVGINVLKSALRAIELTFGITKGFDSNKLTLDLIKVLKLEKERIEKQRKEMEELFGEFTDEGYKLFE